MGLDDLDQGSTNVSPKGPDGDYVRLWRPRGRLSQLFDSAIVARKPPQTIGKPTSVEVFQHNFIDER